MTLAGRKNLASASGASERLASLSTDDAARRRLCAAPMRLDSRARCPFQRARNSRDGGAGGQWSKEGGVPAAKVVKWIRAER